jgi:hypothetical protein
MQPIEGDVVDADADIAELCGRLRESQRSSCAILFCDGEVIVEQRPTPIPHAGSARPSP